jgi:hypothetical protein
LRKASVSGDSVDDQMRRGASAEREVGEARARFDDRAAAHG